MHRTTRTSTPRWRAFGLAAWLACAGAAVAQPAVPVTNELRAAFEAAWARQPEAQALQPRREAAQAHRAAANRWTPEPAALDVLTKTDRITRNQGVREYEVGVSVPLWLPGERGRSAALADAELAAIDSRIRAAQLRVTASLREAWWALHRARIDAGVARDQIDNARRIAADVARRLKAGDLARADQHQAEGAVAAAESGVAQADAAVAAASQHLKAMTGLLPAEEAAVAEPLPDAAQAATHAALAELEDRATLAERVVALAGTQSRANPELTLATTRDRSAFGERYGQTVTVGVRIPFGGGPRHDAKVAGARADATEARAQLELERARIAADGEAAKVRVESSRQQLAAAERRSQLAREARTFFDKSFRLGETDLPTRLRIEAEATEAERQAARARIELAAAISAWRQALGLLP